jgi:flavin reductase (DIM6/NTAB) family NADH-FMN oxidoreductase RutF
LRRPANRRCRLQAVKPPRIADFKSHFECKVEWTKQWLHRLMVCGKVVAASVDEVLSIDKG